MHSSVLTPLDLGGAVALLISLFAVQGCTALKSADDLEPAASAPAHCAHRHPPPPPNVTGRGGTLDLTLAARQTVLGTGSEGDAGWRRYQEIGFDLDNTCTGEGQGTSCVEPSWASGSHTDGLDGIDNAFGQLWWLVAPDILTADANFTNLLLRVRDYSGDPDDDQVEVSLYYALGLSAREDGGVGPLWDGHDRWTVLREALLQPADGGTPSIDEPRFVDTHAYVSGGVLVARFDDALMVGYQSVAPTLLWPVRQLVMAGNLKEDNDGTWELQNTMMGWRVSLKVVAQSGAWIALSNTGAPLCKYPSLYQTEVFQACSFADIAYAPDSSPSATCDAISGGILIQAKQALLGEVAAPSLVTPMCDQSVHPETETCAMAEGD